MDMTWRDRVKAEYTELVARETKLRAFMVTPEFKMLSTYQQDMLTVQLGIMDSYAFILAARMVESEPDANRQ